MAEEHMNPNLNEYQFQFTMLDYEESAAQEPIRSISSGNVDAAAATEKRLKSLNHLNGPSLLVSKCMLTFKVRIFHLKPGLQNK